ncbi:uncharacterized protein I206_101180 [Kwoniella pini CBS 10737]|uniref:Csf1 N-terminal domain-containing protein n=1 Tax=Kwoniella pini CBS 10737 TaxID=1296096 RepID=A0AAJ8KZE3_9TREE
MAVPDHVNLLLLIELAAVVIGASAFLFYWNRLLGSIVAFFIRLYTWRSYNAYLVIGSLQIAPLAGRISFRDVEYHSSNVSVRALHGHITWRYWKFRIRHETDSESSNKKRNKLPCRITVFAEGVEGFVYNRTPAYDAIVERMKKHEREEAADAKDSSRTSNDSTVEPDSTLRSRFKKVVKTSSRGSATTKEPTSENGHADHQHPPDPDHHNVNLVKPAVKPVPEGVNWFREALPIDLRIVTGSVVLGSDATPMVLIGNFKRAEGTVEVTDSRSSLDLYKTSINLTFHDASVIMRTNVDYSGPLLAHGKKVYDELLKRQPDLTAKPPSTLSIFSGFHLLSKQFKFLHDPKFSTPPVAGLPTDRIWKGLARYREPENGEPRAPKREEREYAKVTTLLETHQLDLTYYADTPGLVPHRSEAPYIDDLDEVGNVDLPPEYGIDIVIHKGNVKYGPWADKQRPRLRPGDTRMHTTFVLHLLLEDETIMRIPTREPSKDWQYDNVSTDVERRYGWLDVVVGPNSSISYTQDQVATKQGYDSMVILQLDSIGISSSLSMTMPTPLEWNAQRDWGMDITLDTASISLLRDHVTLISDLAKDWSSAFMDVYGPRLDAYVAVTSTQYRPEMSTVPFSVSLSDARVELCVPKWDTHRAFGPEVLEIGKIGKLTAKGSYLYYAIPKPDLQETLDLHLEGKHVVFKALGWVLRRLFCVKDNYFGSFTQFRTMQEYLEKFDHDPNSVGDPVEEKYRPGRSNPFAVFVTMNVEESLILMSDEIYNCKKGLVIPVPQLQMNLKSVDHFMELSLDATPTYVIASSDLDKSYARGSCPSISETDTVFVEGIEVKANRLFGPQPYATTYLCLWEVAIPKVTAFLGPELVSVLQAAGRSVGYTFSDHENSPSEIYVPKTPPDAAMNLLERGPRRSWQTVGTAKAGATIDIYKASEGWKEMVAQQQEFLRREDRETSRIWYMYQDSEPSFDQHVNGLYLPLPMIERPHDCRTAEDDESIISTSTSDLHQNESSSASSSASEGDLTESQQVRLPNKRSRSYATARETPDSSSVGDESDTLSSATSMEGSVISEKTPAYGDMASALDSRLQAFHLAHHRHLTSLFQESTLTAHPDDSTIPFPNSMRSNDNGDVIRISGKPIDLDLRPTCIGVLTRVLEGLSTGEKGFEKRLDALLVEQVSSVEGESKTTAPQVFDIRTPLINLRLSLGLSDNTTLSAKMAGLDCHLSHHAPRNKQQILDVKARMTSIAILATASSVPNSDISLRDALNLPDLTSNENPVLKLNIDGLEVAAHQSQGLRVHTKLAHTEFDTVTSAAETLFKLLTPWQEALAHLNLHKPLSNLDAHVLYTILQKAMQNGYDTYLPAFAYERAYGLHVQDFRNIRTQTGWCILERFRDWYRRIPANQDLNLAIPLEQMANFVVQNLCRVEETVHGAENIIREQHFIQSVFGQYVTEAAHTRPREKAMDLFLYSDQLKISHHGPALSSKAVLSSSVFLNKSSIGGSQVVGKAEERPLSQVQLVFAVQEIKTDISDSIIGLVQAALVHLPKNEPAPAAKTRKPMSEDHSTVIISDVQLGAIDLNARGGGLRFHLGTRHLHLTGLSKKSTRNSQASAHVSSKETLNAHCESVMISLLQLEDDPETLADRTIVCLQLEGLSTLIDQINKTGKDQRPEFKLAFGLETLDFDSLPQLKALYSFVQAWKRNELPVSTLEEPSFTSRLATADVSIAAAHLQIRAAKSLWLRWDFGKVYISHSDNNSSTRFAVHADPQVVGAYASVRKQKIKTTDSSTLRLPSIIAVGDLKTIGGSNYVTANVELGFFTGVLKPVILDRLLSLHQQLAADVTEFVNDWRRDMTSAISKRHAKGVSIASTESANSSSHKSKELLFNVQVGVAGLRLGLRADDVATTLLFEALAVKGTATNHLTDDHALHWRAKVDHFGLSLGHLGSQALSNDTEPIRNNRTAYMVLDAEVQEIPATAQMTSKLNVNLCRVHTVMHPEALSELADLLKSWMSDLHALRDHRSAEVAEVKVHTTKVLKRLESAEKVEHSEVSWFANRLVFVEVSGIGIAIPLVEGAAIGATVQSDNPALLYSIRMISFQNRRNETARFKVQNMALQFINKFDQSSPEHFTGDFHESVNRMSLPSIDMEAQMSSQPDLWQLSAHCSATDFKLSLSPDVADGIFKLVDLFHHGKERISKLEAQYKSEMANNPYETVSAKYDDPASPVVTRPSQRILVRMSYTFNSGIVELHRGLSEIDKRTLNADLKKTRQWHDTVVLPTVSLWMDYTGPKTVTPGLDTDEGNDASLIFNAAVHESRNLLRPSILPFFVQLINRMQNRAKDKLATMNSSSQAQLDTVQASRSETPAQTISRTTMEKIKMKFSLRIDKSRLRLSCAPDSNAYVDLKWESGGFLASTTIGGNDVTTVAGTISGVTAYLRHEFAEEGRSCIEAGAKDMAFSIAHRPYNGKGQQKGLSIVVDTQLSGQFRLEQFSAWLTFAAVWIDTAPPLDLPPKSAIVDAASTPAPALAPIPIPHQQKLAIVALVRFRSIDFDANVGVTNAKLELTPIVLRTLSNGEFTEVDLDVGVTQLRAKGEISGELRSEHLNFHTSRQSSRSAHQDVPTVLSMAIDAGDLTGSLKLQELSVITFHLEPAVVRLADDWTAFNEDPTAQVNLSFTVQTGVFRSVARLLAIPALLNKVYSITNTFDSQERVASQRSNTYKSMKLRKSTEPSPMAAAIIHTARKAGQSLNPTTNIRTSQTMRFDLGGIELGIFNAPMSIETRGDFYRFMVGKCESDLKRRLTKEGLPKRDLSVMVSFVSWDTSDGRGAARDSAESAGVKDMIESASKHGRREIAWLPLVNMTMKSIEEPRPPIIVYDFDLVWGEGDGDIQILPYFFEQAYKTFDAFNKGLEQEQITKAKRRGEDMPIRRNTSTVNFDIRASAPTNVYSEITNGQTKGRINGLKNDAQLEDLSAEAENKDEDANEELRFRNRLEGQRPLPVPRLRLLGEGTRQAMDMLPRINEFSDQLPVMIHKGITSPLEDGMDLLLKLYEKQLPDRAT